MERLCGRVQRTEIFQLLHFGKANVDDEPETRGTLGVPNGFPHGLSKSQVQCEDDLQTSDFHNDLKLSSSTKLQGYQK
jgi:hypothetical protein